MTQKTTANNFTLKKQRTKPVNIFRSKITTKETLKQVSLGLKNEYPIQDIDTFKKEYINLSKKVVHNDTDLDQKLLKFLLFSTVSTKYKRLTPALQIKVINKTFNMLYEKHKQFPYLNISDLCFNVVTEGFIQQGKSLSREKTTLYYLNKALNSKKIKNLEIVLCLKKQ